MIIIFPYQHLRTLNHPLVIILLENSNDQSCVTYISSYCPPNQISIVHSEELHVMDYLSKFYLNQTVNEPGNAVLRKLRKTEKKRWRLTPRNKEGGAWRDYTTAGRFLFCKKYRKHRFSWIRAPRITRQAVPAVLGTPTFFLAHVNLNPLTTTLSSTNLWLYKIRFHLLGLQFIL